MYTGKSMKTKRKNPLAFDVVTKLLKGLSHRGHHLFIDNYYTTIELMDHLQKQQIGVTGTVNMARVCFPKALKEFKLEKGILDRYFTCITLMVGDSYLLVKDDKTLVKWLNKRDVYAIPNI